MSILPSAPPKVGPTSGYGATGTDTQQAFRDADFMKILLAEITQQDPFEPQETSKIVEGMQKLQELANSRFEKFRDDQRWARDLVGQPVSVQQVQETPAELEKLREKGLNPDVGYMTVTGVVERYRIVNETVWLSIDGLDYPIDHVAQIESSSPGGEQLGTVAAGMLGRHVRYLSEDGLSTGDGVVTAVGLSATGVVELSIGSERVPVSRVQRISVN